MNRWASVCRRKYNAAVVVATQRSCARGAIPLVGARRVPLAASASVSNRSMWASMKSIWQPSHRVAGGQRPRRDAPAALVQSPGRHSPAVTYVLALDCCLCPGIVPRCLLYRGFPIRDPFAMPGAQMAPPIF